MKKLLFALTLIAAVLLSKDPFSGDASIVIPPLSCPGFFERWDENGDGETDYVVIRPDKECVERMMERFKKTAPKDGA